MTKDPHKPDPLVKAIEAKTHRAEVDCVMMLVVELRDVYHLIAGEVARQGVALQERPEQIRDLTPLVPLDK